MTHAEYQRTRYHRFASEGRCSKCGREKVAGKGYCADCLFKAGQNYYNRIGKGLCVTCGIELPMDEKRTQCEDCRAKRKNHEN